jgi:transposase InsO family protein
LGVDGLRKIQIVLKFGPEGEVLSRNKRLPVEAVEVSVGRLPKEHAEELRTLLKEFSDIFGEIVPGSAKGVRHRIELEKRGPVVKRPYRMALIKQEKVEGHVKDMLGKGIIQESSSPFCAPVVLAAKKDGTDRFCVDYTALNAVTKKDRFPLPRIDDLLDKLKGAKLFSCLDLASGYWQVKMQEGDEEKTAFSTPQGHYEFKVMPFGLTNAPGTFQRLMNKVLGGIKGVIVYIDDILVFSEDWPEHLKILKQVFQALREHGLKLKASKCHFAQEKVKFVGHVLDAEGCRPDPEKVESIRLFPKPKNETELRRFLGMANYYRRFMKDYACLAAPLYRLTSGDEWIWTDVHDKAFDALKEKLMTEPVLAQPDLALPFKLYTDASDAGMGAVLAQEQAGGEKVIAYASQHFSRAEVRKYSTIEKEAAAVLWACKKFDPYLHGARFRIVSDHAPLKWLFGKVGAKGRIGRWQAHLLEFEGLEGIDHLKGSLNVPADTLSRVPEILSMSGSNTSISAEELRRRQDEDEDFAKQKRNFKLEGGVWRYMGRIFIPRCFRERLLDEYHGLGVHFGLRRTMDLVQALYFWPKMSIDVRQKIENCDICHRTKIVPGTIPQSLPAAQRPFQRIAMDFAGPLRTTRKRNKYFLVVVDEFSRFVKIFPTKDCSSSSVVTCFEQVCLEEGIPEEVLTDNGTHFTAECFEEVLRRLGVKHLRTAPYHPQSNGMAERMVQTVKKLVQAELIERGSTLWDESLSKIVLTYNSTRHPATGFSPFALARGRTSGLPQSRWLRVPDKVAPVKVAWKDVQDRSAAFKAASCKTKGGRKAPEFQQGQKVWWRRPGRTGNWTAGLVSKKIGRVMYRLDTNQVVHVDHLRKREI